jgi:hypothetical protein
LIHHNSSAAYSTEQVKLADDLFVVPFQNTIELQSTEQGIMNVEGLKNTSYFDIPCSIFDIQKALELSGKF